MIISHFKMNINMLNLYSQFSLDYFQIIAYNISVDGRIVRIMKREAGQSFPFRIWKHERILRNYLMVTFYGDHQV